jgi:hypothetical protein
MNAQNQEQSSSADIREWLDNNGNLAFEEPEIRPHAADSPRDDAGEPQEPPD